MNLRIPSSKFSYRKFHVLSVSFKLSKDESTDKEVTKLVGVKPTGYGPIVKRGFRDLNFQFEKETAAESAQKVLQKAGFVSHIKTYETDTP